jgi:hypothetical protein
MPFESLKASWEVRAGVIPGQPRPEFTRRWHYTSAQREEDEKSGNDMTYHATFSKLRAEAIDYYLQVSLPQLNNWADITFLWY